MDHKHKGQAWKLACPRRWTQPWMRVSPIKYFYTEWERERKGGKKRARVSPPRLGGKVGEFGRHTDKRRNYCRFGNADVSKSRKLCIGTGT